MVSKAALSALLRLQAELNDVSIESWDAYRHPGYRLEEPDSCTSRIMFADLGGVLAVSYFGDIDEAFALVAATLADPDVAPHIVSLHIDGPDTGANGTRDWNFAPILAAQPIFSSLRDFVIRKTRTGDHNSSVVEDDQLGSLLTLMPKLRSIVIPQAPEPVFFEHVFPELRMIEIGMEHRTHGFIARLATAKTLPSLGFLDFTDSLAPWTTYEAQPEDWSATPFEDYERLFKSSAMDRVHSVRLRNTRLTEDQYRALHAIRPALQFSVVLETPHVYVSHWDGSTFPFRHLLPFG